MSKALSPAFSVIIPLSRNDQSWRSLCSCLLLLPENCEVIFIRPQRLAKNEQGFLSLLKKHISVLWLTGRQHRGSQMNLGAKYASKPFLWFLHGDSRFGPDAVSGLQKSLVRQPGSLHYFDLQFLNDGPALVCLNQWMANFRSQGLGVPFGDQGFCLSKDMFNRLGTFDTRCRYGEDHLLVWAARCLGVPLQPVGVSLQTSARKYKKNGWMKTTAGHFVKTWTQALPWYVKERRARFSELFSMPSGSP